MYRYDMLSHVKISIYISITVLIINISHLL